MSKIKTFGWIGRIRKVLGRNLKLSSGNTVDSQQIANKKKIKADRSERKVLLFWSHQINFCLNSKIKRVIKKVKPRKMTSKPNELFNHLATFAPKSEAKSIKKRRHEVAKKKRLSDKEPRKKQLCRIKRRSKLESAKTDKRNRKTERRVERARGRQCCFFHLHWGRIKAARPKQHQLKKLLVPASLDPLYTFLR